MVSKQNAQIAAAFDEKPGTLFDIARNYKCEGWLAESVQLQVGDRLINVNGMTARNEILHELRSKRCLFMLVYRPKVSRTLSQDAGNGRQPYPEDDPGEEAAAAVRTVTAAGATNFGTGGSAAALWLNGGSGSV